MGLTEIVAGLLVLAAADPQTRAALPGTPPPHARIADLAWLQGEWHGDGYGGPATEVYSAPQAGGIAGHFLQEDGKGAVLFYELLQIVPRGQTLVYRLRHFNADLTGWEDAKGGKAVEFPLVAVEDNRFFFDGLTLVREGPDTFTVWVKIAEDGKAAQDVPFRYRRIR
ncbi:DUF6265 family protein [Sphingomonas sp. PL-96]|uniref:DUF6265 family protein n=1 Tax=Sphingomonas sp. PL-96 TaxID=2887201 RepID=UPI001E644DA6|nr:DUF6265 family protein [Sphingomonas sp. PL-96]MCC2977504.1 DUF6265 family protein [Sphingomonas sp. PL-96]